MVKPSLEVLEHRTMPSFVSVPPELNSALLLSGSGSDPMFAAAAAWDGLAGELSSAAVSFAVLTGGAAVSPLGQSTPSIVAKEANYTEMWAQDIAVMADQVGVALPSPSTGVVPAAADEVSAALSALFGAHAETYQTLSSQAAAFHEQFIQSLNAASGSYAGTESANPGTTG